MTSADLACTQTEHHGACGSWVKKCASLSSFRRGPTSATAANTSAHSTLFLSRRAGNRSVHPTLFNGKLSHHNSAHFRRRSLHSPTDRLVFPISFTSNKFLVLSKKLRYVFVNTAPDHDAGFGLVFLHRSDLDFNSITVKVCCNLDFQYRTNFWCSSTCSLWLGSVIISRMGILST